MSLANQYNYVVKVIENDRLKAENESLREYLERDTALVAQQAAVIAQMREALRCIVNKDAWRLYKVNEELLVKAAVALQPCPEVLNKVRADAVGAAVDAWMRSPAYINDIRIDDWFSEYINSIERGEA